MQNCIAGSGELNLEAIGGQREVSQDHHEVLSRLGKGLCYLLIKSKIADFFSSFDISYCFCS